MACLQVLRDETIGFVAKQITTEVIQCMTKAAARGLGELTFMLASTDRPFLRSKTWAGQPKVFSSLEIVEGALRSSGADIQPVSDEHECRMEWRATENRAIGQKRWSCCIHVWYVPMHRCVLQRVQSPYICIGCDGTVATGRLSVRWVRRGVPPRGAITAGSGQYM